jgi:hypothetical protein
MEKVEIVVTAKDSASQVLRGISSSFGGIGSAIQMLTAGGAIEALTTELVKFGKESVDATVAYADEVRRLSQISGDSAEETSRLIQLADDYKISTGDLTVAMRKLTSEGLSLNVQTLAKLSDEYLNLNPGQERAAFLMGNFGRQGVKFAEIMAKGGTAILELNEGIDENLILTEEAIQQARDYEFAMDAWGEQTQKLQYAFARGAIPAITEFVNVLNTQLDPAWQEWDKHMVETNWNAFNAEWWSSTASIKAYQIELKKLAPDMDSATQSYVAMAEAMSETTTETDITTASLEDQERTLEELSRANEAYIGNVQRVAGIERDYNAEMTGIAEDRKKVESERAALISQGWSENSEAVKEYDRKMAELDGQMADSKAKHKEATDSMILDNFLRELSVGGLKTTEMEMYLSLEVAMGRITEKDKDRAIVMGKLTSAAADGKISMEDFGKSINDVPDIKNVDIYIRTHGVIPTLEQDIAREPGERRGGNNNRAAGGAVNSGEWYRVNETNQEYFRANTNGTVLPIGPGGGGSGVTVVVNANTVVGDRAHLESYLLPVIREGLRQVGAGR